MYADDTTIYFNLEDFDSNKFEFEINAELQKGPKEYSLHVVGLLLLQRSTNCTHSSCPPQWGPVSTVFWAGRPSGPAGWLAQLLLKAGDVETNPGPKHTRTQVWICDICHRHR